MHFQTLNMWHRRVFLRNFMVFDKNFNIFFLYPFRINTSLNKGHREIKSFYLWCSLCGNVKIREFTIFLLQDWPPLLNTVLSYPLSQSLQDMPTDKTPSPHQNVMSHGLATANCESTSQSQPRQFDAEGSAVTDGWVTSPVQTFGLSVEPFSVKV